MATAEIVRLRLAVQVAMLGMVKPNLRCVLASWNSGIKLRAIYDETLISDDVDDISIIETELISNFWPDCGVECTADSLSARQKIQMSEGEVMIYHRAESRDYEK